MFGMKELKPSIEINETSVECLVKDCSEKVERQRKVFKKEDRFKCPKHNIFISPSTFEYPSELDNLLWKESPDLELLEKIRTVKRESRMARDNSEDAVTWNVFRFLERNKLLSGLLAKLRNLPVNTPEIIYWSYSQSQQGAWSELAKARSEFGESPKRSSEPDLIVKSEKALFFIEAKLTATNNTPTKKEEAGEKTKNQKKYITGGNNWFEGIFRSDYKTIVLEQKYELLRFWLIGTWIAEHLSLDFYLVNLVRQGYEEDIESNFGKHIRQSERRKFVRITWEDIYKYIKNSNIQTLDKPIVVRYFENKTTGYNNDGILQKAFQCPLPEIPHLTNLN